MFKLKEGVHKFQQTYFKANQTLYKQLHSGQNPEILFITCSDSRILPDRLIQSQPGEICVIRNAGNIIPDYPYEGGEAATIEYATTSLNIKHIIVCGHSQCGAMNAVIHPETTQRMPIVNEWLKHAPKREEIIKEVVSNSENALLDKAIAKNVLLQIERLKQMPCVKAKMNGSEDKLEVHAWIYKFETGEVYTFDYETKKFELLSSDFKIMPVETWFHRFFTPKSFSSTPGWDLGGDAKNIGSTCNLL